MRLVLTEAAKVDIRAVLRSTRAQFGPMQVSSYRALISEARLRLTADPGVGHHREGLPPEGRLFHISRTGRPASHLFLYWVNEAEQRIEVLRVLHDAMDIPRYWQERP